jgi:hypothetical protein
MGGKTSGAGPLCQLTCRPSRSDGACFRLVSQHRQPPPPPQAACTAPASARQGSVAARRVLTHPAACNRTQAARQSPILHWRKALRCFSHTPAAKPVRQLAGLPDYGPLYGIAGSRLHPDDKQTASRPYRADGASVESAAGGPPRQAASLDQAQPRQSVRQRNGVTGPVVSARCFHCHREVSLSIG